MLQSALLAALLWTRPAPTSAQDFKEPPVPDAVPANEDPFKRLDELVELLDDDAVAIREAAQTELEGLADRQEENSAWRAQARAWLGRRLSLEQSSRLAPILRALPDFKLKIRVEGPPVVGQKIKVHVSLKNVSGRERLVAVGYYDGPSPRPKHFSLDSRAAGGPKMRERYSQHHSLPLYVDLNPGSMAPESLRRLADGDEIDPCVDKRFADLEFIAPAAPGLHQFTLSIREDEGQVYRWLDGKWRQVAGIQKEADYSWIKTSGEPAIVVTR